MKIAELFKYKKIAKIDKFLASTTILDIYIASNHIDDRDRI